MRKFRYAAALLAAKLSVIALKLTKRNGTNFPGLLAIKICPDFLAHIGKPEKIVGITGTNGKTTVSNLLVDALEAKGIAVLNNRLGSNIHFGIATSLLRGANLFGKSRYEMAVLEIDERATPKILPYIKPEYMLVTNLFRDSIKRNAHTEYIAGILNANIPKETKLILNADDLISARLCSENERVYFGITKMDSDRTESINLINDITLCPICSHKLKYEYLRYHHIGKAYCSHCGFKAPEYDYFGSNVDFEKMAIDIGDADERVNYKLISDGIHNIYNMVSCVAVLKELGIGYRESKELLKKVKIVGSRYSKELCGDVFVANQMAKENNALGSSRAFDYVAGQKGDKELVLMMNCLGDEKTWSENTSWLYDCDFEYLNDQSIKRIIVTGPRGKDYHLRLLLAGVPEEKIIWVKSEIDAPDKLEYTKGESIFIFYGTDSIALGERVLAKTKDIARKRRVQ
ncbi:MAG: MurT ligase domain-containing protein [Hornefia sp.]|nr:MurT ligase domain-containing protein [Hornefia sp.]